MAEIYKNPAEYAAALTKRNHAGQQQPYVPAGNGDESGEYRDNAYGGGVDEEEIIDTNDKVEVQPKEQENNDNISVIGDESSKSSSFESYVNENHKDTDFGKDLISNYNLGNDDSKMLVDTMCNLAGVKVTKTGGIANYSGSVNLAIGDIREQGAFSSYVEGEVFYHEFHHCFDERLAQNIVDPKTGEVLFEGLVTEEDRNHVLQGQQEKTRLGGMSFVTTYHLSRNLSTGKVLSNGKTLYETIQAECKEMKKQGIWSQLINDYKEETEGQVLAKYPDWKERQTQFNEIEYKIREEARKKYPISWQDLEMDNVMRTKREEYIKEELEKNAPGFNDYIREVRNYRNQLERDAKKSWMSISDMYGIYYKTPYGFCGGHAGNYSKKIPGAIALEFLAEYGSARSRGDKFAEKEIAIMQKYMPESSKMCDELRDLMIKAVKGE